MSENITAFSDAGATLVWVLAESHVAMHYWGWEGFLTIDIHVCDYTSSNAEKASRLKQMLEEFCFSDGLVQWTELVLPHPPRPMTEPRPLSACCAQ
jgi:S-adenosylmethionine decarboxylase